MNCGQNPIPFIGSKFSGDNVIFVRHLRLSRILNKLTRSLNKSKQENGNSARRTLTIETSPTVEYRNSKSVEACAAYSTMFSVVEIKSRPDFRSKSTDGRTDVRPNVFSLINLIYTVGRNERLSIFASVGHKYSAI